MKCAGPVGCTTEATWWVETREGEHRQRMATPRCDLHASGAVMLLLRRPVRVEVRLVPLPAWN